MNSATVHLSIVIPCFNESACVEKTLRDLVAILESVASISEYEVILVDDGSTDDTARKAEATGIGKIIRHHRNLGYGAALKTGVANARFELICITDCDGTYPNRFIPELLKEMSEYNSEMAVGARVGASVAIPLVRRPAKWFLRTLAKYLTGCPIPDLNSGLRIFRKEVFNRFFSFLPDGFSLTTTITMAMLSNGLTVRFVPIDYYPRIGRSKIRPIHDTLNFMLLVVRMGLFYRPLKFFVPIAFILFMLAIAIAVFSFVFFGQIADISTLVLAVAAFQVAMIACLAELINVRLGSFMPRHDYERNG